MSSQNIQLHYYPIRGIIQSIRIALAYCELEYENVTYNSKEEWFKVKETLTNDFKNVPYIKDGDFELTESSAIFNYIINKYKPELKGSNPQDIAKVDQINGVQKDIFINIWKLIFLPDYDSQRLDKFESDFKPKLTLLDNYVKGKFIRGDQLYSCDLYFFEINEWLLSLFPEKMSGFSKLQSVYNNMKNLPVFQKYIKSDNYYNKQFIPPNYCSWKME